jgi:AcrR family transcriptional regulator
VSPRRADPDAHQRLLAAAARLMAEEGARALTARRLATEAGTSTMAVYTRFGGMDEVRDAVRAEGFARLSASLDAVARTADPVRDLVAAGAAYLRFGLDQPDLYRAMFLDPPRVPGAGTVGHGAFGRLVAAVRRCVDAGRFRDEVVAPDVPGVPPGADAATGWAVQLWTMRHGVVSLATVGLIPPEQVGLHVADMSLRLFLGYGDDRDSATRSIAEGMAHSVAAGAASRAPGDAAAGSVGTRPGRPGTAG